jgi:hydrogenase small subunit
MSTTAEEQAAQETDEGVIHILWMNGGLSCDGDSVALTAATQPSIEEIVLGRCRGSRRSRSTGR